MKLGFIGTGKIASSVITGICNSKIKFKQIIISPRNKTIANSLKRKFNKIIHPSSTADISHMVNQFLPGKLPDELIGKIANLEIQNLAEHDLRCTINTGAIVAQIITDHLQEQAVQAPAQTVAATKIQALVRGRKGREEAWEETVGTGQTHAERLATRGQAGSTKSCSL